eukprot:TRINITY_DN35501_c0_g1_i1.p2 TRINITY_DN35501_c0_g1~~TRINITY_DN35501_c0_g1_i1.p2  ORF type:complete len:313 (+),score=41.74 TRINITY_DN35501_c0_g1_i1:72-1010(+)
MRGRAAAAEAFTQGFAHSPSLAAAAPRTPAARRVAATAGSGATAAQGARAPQQRVDWAARFAAQRAARLADVAPRAAPAPPRAAVRPAASWAELCAGIGVPCGTRHLSQMPSRELARFAGRAAYMLHAGGVSQAAEAEGSFYGPRGELVHCAVGRSRGAAAGGGAEQGEVRWALPPGGDAAVQLLVAPTEAGLRVWLWDGSSGQTRPGRVSLWGQRGARGAPWQPSGRLGVLLAALPPLEREPALEREPSAEAPEEEAPEQHLAWGAPAQHPALPVAQWHCAHCGAACSAPAAPGRRLARCSACGSPRYLCG